MSAMGGDAEVQADRPAQDREQPLPSIAGNNDFGGDSVAIAGQSGQVSPAAEWI